MVDKPSYFLCLHFQDSLEIRREQYDNKECGDCLHLVLSNAAIRSVVTLYLVWFEKKTKYEQHCILLDYWNKAYALCDGNNILLLNTWKMDNVELHKMKRVTFLKKVFAEPRL